MSSLLRVVTVTPATVLTVSNIQRPTAHSPPARKQKVSRIQSYYLAYTARGKLLKEVTRDNCSLRLLVGHANLLDSLSLDLANAEQEQRISFNNTVVSAATASEKPKQSQRVSLTDRHINAKDRVVEDEIYNEGSNSDSDDDEKIRLAIPVRSAARSIQIPFTKNDNQDREDDDPDSEVVFSPTDSQGPVELSLPNLVFEDSPDKYDSEEDSIQPFLPSIGLCISKKPLQATTATSFCQSPSKPIDYSFFCLKKTSKSPLLPLGFRFKTLFLMIRSTIHHYFCKPWKAMPGRAYEWASTV